MEVSDCILIGIASGLGWLLAGFIIGVEPIKVFQIAFVIGFCCFLAFGVMVVAEKIGVE